jgi:hypothetical protein
VGKAVVEDILPLLETWAFVDKAVVEDLIPLLETLALVGKVDKLACLAQGTQVCMVLDKPAVNNRSHHSADL